MKTMRSNLQPACLAVILGLTASPVRSEQSTILLEDFETHWTGYLDPPWIGMPGSSWNHPRVSLDESKGSRMVAGQPDRWLEGAMRPMPFAFSTDQSSLIFQFEGRTTTNGQPYDLAGRSLSQLEFRNDSGETTFFGFGLYQDHYDGGPSADPPTTQLRDGTGTSHLGDNLEPETWYEFRGLIDWTVADEQNRRGAFTLQYRQLGSPTWITDSTIQQLGIKVAAPEMATMLALRVDQNGSWDGGSWHQGQMDNIRYQAPTTDTVIGFETSEGYNAGQAPIAPWQFDPAETITVTDKVKHGDDQSLKIGPDGSTVIFPTHIPPGASAEFSIWVRPAFHTANYELLAGIGVREMDVASNFWYRTAGLVFENNIDHAGTGGSTPFSLVTRTSEAFIARDGDFTPGQWYQVRCAITPKDITYRVRLDTGTVSRSIERYENYRIDQIILNGNSWSEAYFDEFIYSAPPAPVTLTVASAHGAPVPAVGEHVFEANAVVMASVENVTVGLSQQACIGWTGTGSVPESGNGSQLEITLQVDSTLTWNWETRHWLEMTLVGNGSVNLGNEFLAADSEQQLLASPASGWLFIGWEGDLSGMNASETLAMTGPRSVMAIFSEDADGDGLTNEQELALGTDPRNRDTDGDGFEDKLEVDHGGSPLVSDAWRIDHIRAHGDEFDLYPSDVVLHVDLGQMMLQVMDGQARMRLQLMQSGDLRNWFPAGEPVEWQWPVDPGKKFFRVGAAK